MGQLEEGTDLLDEEKTNTTEGGGGCRGGCAWMCMSLEEAPILSTIEKNTGDHIVGRKNR